MDFKTYKIFKYAIFCFLYSNLFMGFIFGGEKVQHVVKDRFNNRKKVTCYTKTGQGFLITQIVDYYDDGTRYSIYTYKNGLKHGNYLKWKRINKKNNNGILKQTYFLSEKGNYKNGNRSGGMKVFHRDGQLHWKGIYRDGKIIGPVNEFHPNGQLHRELFYLDGEKNGRYKAYYVNGSLEIEGEYFRGMRVGNWKFYSPDHNLIENITYKEGQPWEGTYTNWNHRKKIISCIDDSMVFGFSYENGDLSLIYRDENKNIFICTSKNKLLEIKQNI